MHSFTLFLFSDHDLKSSHGNRGDNIRGPAELQLSSQTSQDEDERDGNEKKKKSQVTFGNKIQRKDHSGQTGVAKTKSKRPASPYHISSLHVYQKHGGKGFTRSRNYGAETKLEEPAADDENNVSSSDLRAKWFLSINQWQGFIPLQIPGIDSLCNEEISDHDSQPACSDNVTDSTEMSSSVSESLEKMKENHSLFYKIACDLSISDTDITKNDGNVNSQTSSQPEEEQKLLITESATDDKTSNAGRSSDPDSTESNFALSTGGDGSSLSADNKLQYSKLESHEKEMLNTSASPGRETHVYEEIQQIEGGGTSSQESRLKLKETQDEECNQDLEECEKTRKEQSEDRKADKEQTEGPKKCSSLNEENEETVQEQGDGNSITPSSSAYEGGSVSRSASFGKARVTVLRTSF